MAFENSYGGYTPQYAYNPQNYQQKNNQPSGGYFIWVNSRKEAEEYPLGANGALMMMNRNEKVFYLKACDGFGMVQSFKEFPYTEKTDAPIAENPSTADKPVEYVSREEFAQLKAELEALKTQKSKDEKREDKKV